MIIRYSTPDGETKEWELTKNSITIGRSPEVDIALPDKLVSRIHCGISYWDDSYFVRDFKSRNGTFLNDRPVDVARIHPGDRIRVGDTIFHVEARTRKGTDTVIQEVCEEMEQGKGYHTILQEIIREERKT